MTERGSCFWEIRPGHAVPAGVLVWCLLAAAAVRAQERFHAYIGRTTADSFLLAWGDTVRGGNSIGRNSRSLGAAEVEVSGRSLSTSANWLEVNGLSPDTSYTYKLRINGEPKAEGTVRTLPRTARKLAFLLFGDYGNGSASQYVIAAEMQRAMESRLASDNPVRFVLTTGDNIYSTRVFGMFPKSTGLFDRDWEDKFFKPYRGLLRSIPFYPTLGNHDLKMAERGDGGEVSTYLDNFFFPSDTTKRYYSFSVGEFVDFFALDSNSISLREDRNDLGQKGAQYQWLSRALATSKAAWKIVYFHHPPFSAGPTHPGLHEALRPAMDLFRQYGVQVVFSGHEHNFQVAHRNEQTDPVLYVLSGGGGQLRSGEIRSRMTKANIAAAARQRHFVLVEIVDQRMSITPLADEPVRLIDASGARVELPITVER